MTVCMFTGTIIDDATVDKTTLSGHPAHHISQVIKEHGNMLVYHAQRGVGPHLDMCRLFFFLLFTITPAQKMLYQLVFVSFFLLLY